MATEHDNKNRVKETAQSVSYRMFASELRCRFDFSTSLRLRGSNCLSVPPCLSGKNPPRKAHCLGRLKNSALKFWFPTEVQSSQPRSPNSFS